jgi:PhnB protein
MHAAFKVGDSTVFASDGRASGQPSFQGFALSLTVRDEREADRLFADAGRRRAGDHAADRHLLLAALRA